jgi:hypothetical protein
MESITISTPTAIINGRAGTCLTVHPPNGAARRPPSTSGIRCSGGEAPSSAKNVVAAAAVTKNSVVLTEPTVWRGACPEPMSVEVVSGPQPPPPLNVLMEAFRPLAGLSLPSVVVRTAERVAAADKQFHPAELRALKLIRLLMVTLPAMKRPPIFRAP